MATGKRYYWIKLKDTFMTSDAVDFLMGQKDGANYVVLYQMLCLKTINTGGRLERTIGEVIIPYDEEKIQRDTKWFTIDTVRVALNLYKSLGLIYADDNGVLCLTDHDNMVGSATDYADQKKLQREKQQNLLPDGGVDNVHSDVHENVHTDIRYIDIEIDKKKESKKKESAKRFTPPTLEELEAYKSEARLSVDCKNFLDYYESNGWMVGKNHMKDWKATMRRWSNTQKESARSGTPNRFQNFEQRSEDLDKYMVRNIGRLV